MKNNIKLDDGIGMNIAKMRTSAGLSQEQLAAKLQTSGCDISRGTLAKIEVGIRHIKIIELKAIVKVLQTTYEFLIDGENSK